VSTNPVPIYALPDLDDDDPMVPPVDRHLVVNRAQSGDANVVISFNASGYKQGIRDAFGIPPDEAIKMAAAILNAVNAVNGNS
jgi:hypothetical protein